MIYKPFPLMATKKKCLHKVKDFGYRHLCGSFFFAYISRIISVKHPDARDLLSRVSSTAPITLNKTLNEYLSTVCSSQ